MNKKLHIAAAIVIAIASPGLLQAKPKTTPPGQPQPVITQPAETTFQFTSDHVTGGAGTPPFGTVTLTQNGANVDFNVALTTGYSFILTGSADFQYFKFNGVGVTLADITNINQNFTGFTLSADTGAFNGDGTGDFTFGITSDAGTGGSNPYAGPLSFTVQNATIADLTQPNNDGIIFVGDILAPNGNTGPVDVSAVPEPSVMLLLPFGGILGFALRSRIKR